MQYQKILLCAVGLYFLYTGAVSGSWGSALIGIGLAAIAFYVAFTGRVHRKFTRRAESNFPRDPSDPSAYRDPDDQQVLEMFHGLKKHLTHGQSVKDETSSD